MESGVIMPASRKGSAINVFFREKRKYHFLDETVTQLPKHPQILIQIKPKDTKNGNESVVIFKSVNNPYFLVKDKKNKLETLIGKRPDKGDNDEVRLHRSNLLPGRCQMMVAEPWWKNVKFKNYFKYHREDKKDQRNKIDEANTISAFHTSYKKGAECISTADHRKMRYWLNNSKAKNEAQADKVKSPPIAQNIINSRGNNAWASREAEANAYVTHKRYKVQDRNKRLCFSVRLYQIKNPISITVEDVETRGRKGQFVWTKKP